jgi:hypothetical protein
MNFPEGLPSLIRDSLLNAASTQFCKFISDIKYSEKSQKYEIDAIIGAAEIPLGGSSDKYKVRFQIPKTFPYNVVETIPIEPDLKWNPHQFADGDYPRANIICPPSLNEVFTEELLLPYIRHAYKWINDCLNNILVKPNEDFEFPHLGEEKTHNHKFFIEAELFPRAWIVKNKFGRAWITELEDISEPNRIFLVKDLESLSPRDSSEPLKSTLKTGYFKEEKIGGWVPWVFVGSPVFKLPHERFHKISDMAPEVRSNFLIACKNIIEMKHRLPYLLLAFEIPEIWSGPPSKIYWTSIKLNKFDSENFKVPPTGFRSNSDFRYWPKVQIFFNSNDLVSMNDCTDVSQSTMKLRTGLENTNMESKSICVVGMGALGSMVTRSISKLSPSKLTLVDAEKLEPGNLIRHEGLSFQVDTYKAVAMAAIVQPMFNTDEVVPLVADAIVSPKFKETALASDLIIDCTANPGLNQILLNSSDFSSQKVVMGFIKPGPNFGVLILKKANSRLSRGECFNKLQEGIPNSVWEEYKASDISENQMVRTAPGCYTTTFPAPFHRVRIMADLFLESILTWLNAGANSNYILLIQQSARASSLGLDIKRYEVALPD